MPKLRVSVGGHALLDIGSYARRGPGRDRLTPAEVAHISRTVRRAPEVVVKVLPRASNDLKAVGKHLDYIGREGEVELETDDGERVRAPDAKALLEDWDLDIDDVRRQSALAATRGRKPPKLVHKLMFSMPPGTSPEKVLGAVRNFAREEFWGQHRYVFALHTDEAHPHVHLVLKAVSERGVRLNIRKTTLRHWRWEFARHLRLLGVEANATERAVRGQNRKARKDGIYRASLRAESTYVRAQAAVVAKELVKGSASFEHGKRKLVETRNAVEDGWRSVAGLLARDGYLDLARDVHRFVDRMSPPRTDRERVAHELRQRTHDPRVRDDRTR
jgi:Relaxase/Mobilisation nuclease domain